MGAAADVGIAGVDPQTRLGAKTATVRGQKPREIHLDDMLGIRRV